MSEKPERLEWIRWRIEHLLEARPHWSLDEHAEYLALIDEETALLDQRNAAQEA